jgi:chorismate dehydratase
MSSRVPSPSREATRLRLGNIIYSNCFPVHARLLDRPEEGDPYLVDGVPSLLNGLLARGIIDAAPSSSIEFALHADRYRILPDLAIGSRGPVRSILFLTGDEPRALGGRVVAVPTASATSVVLLRILLRIRWGVEPVFQWFDQTRDDPFAEGASAALFIGDVALRNGLYPSVPLRFDLGLEWWSETGLPFAFAVWQTPVTADAPLLQLHRTLLESRRYGSEEVTRLAHRYSDRFSMTPAALHRYWTDLSYELDDSMVEGLETFYRLAAEIGAIPRVPELRWVG